ELRDGVVFDVRARAREVELLLGAAEARDLLQQLGIGVAEVALYSRAVLEQFLRVLHDALLVLVVEAEELVLRGHVQLDDGEEDVGVEVELAEAVLELPRVPEEALLGQILEARRGLNLIAQRADGQDD